MKTEIREWATTIDAALRCNDFINTVYVEHEDGSAFCLQNALFMVYEACWFIVFTEHCGYFIFAKDDLRYFCVDNKFNEEETFFLLDKRDSIVDNNCD